jgi:predicted nuclease with TOPRIM domain
MSQDNELRRLEQFVEKLLARFSELRAEKAKLLQELRERELQVEDLRNNLSSRDMERSEISQRVSKIVEQIEEWETGLEQIADVASEPEATMDSGVVCEEAVSPAQEIVEEQKGEEEVRGQQNLFSIGNTHR